MHDIMNFQPGNRTGKLRPTKAQQNDIEMLADAMRSLDTAVLLDEVLQHIAARPDVKPQDLEAFGNKVCRHAWQIERSQ